jgi:type II secretory pathway pseudopilin PulG
LRRLATSEGGFGLVELLIAMTVMVIAIMAIVAAFSSGIVTLGRAATASTGAAVADKQMEAYRALPNCAIYLDSASIPASGAYTTDSAYPGAGASTTSNTPLMGPATCVASTPATLRTAQQNLVGADGKSYPVNTYIATSGTAPGAYKRVTLVVSDPPNTKVLVRESSTFTPPTGCNNPAGQQSTGC